MNAFTKALAGVLAALPLGVLPVPGVAADDAIVRVDRTMIGNWKLVSVLDFAEIASLDQEEAARLVGTHLIIRSDRIRIADRTCESPSFQVERVERDRELRSSARLRGSTLGLPDPVTLIALGCTHAYVRDRDHVVLLWKGAFFGATRVRR